MEVDGKRMGPFSTEQILGLLQDGEIRPETRITSAELRGKWITARELASSAAGSAAHFQPPPRPAEIGTAAPAQPAEAKPGAAADPALSLFDTLKAAKDKQSASRQITPPPLETQPRGNPLTAVPAKVWIGAGTAVALAASIWAMVGYIKSKTAGGILPPPPGALQPPPPGPGAPPPLPNAAGAPVGGPGLGAPPPLGGAAFRNTGAPVPGALPGAPFQAGNPPAGLPPPPQPVQESTHENYPSPPEYPPPPTEAGAPFLAPAPPPAPPPPPPPAPGADAPGSPQENPNDPAPPPAPPPPPLPE